MKPASPNRSALRNVLLLLPTSIPFAASAPDGLPVTGGLALHLDAANQATVAVAAEGSLSRWNDTSAHGLRATQEEAASRPEYIPRTANGKPAVRFDGRDDYLVFDRLALKDFAAFVVFTTREEQSLLLGDTENRDWVRVEPNGVKVKWQNVPAVVSGASPTVDATQLCTVVRRDKAVRFALNGASAGETTKEEPFAPEHLGHKSTGGATENFFSGDMHELLVYDRALSDVECRQVEAYLAAKWDVGAANGPLAPTAPATGLSHGPMLGAVSPTMAAIWLRTLEPCEVRLTLTSAGTATQTATLRTDETTDNTAVARFEGLAPDTEYTYEISAGAAPFRATFRTFGPSMKNRTVRLAYGYGCNPGNRMKEGSIFTHMAERKPDHARTSPVPLAV